MDCSLSGSSVHGIFQARVLEWGAIAFSMDTSISFQMVGEMEYVGKGLSVIWNEALEPPEFSPRPSQADHQSEASLALSSLL